MILTSEKRYYGTAVSEGIGFGKAYPLIIASDILQKPLTKGAFSPEQEKTRFMRARELFCSRTEMQARNIEERARRQDTQILLLQRALAYDTQTQAEIFALLDNGCSAETAVDQVWAKLRESVQNRAADMEDVRLGLLAALTGTSIYASLKSVPDGSVLITTDLSPALVSHLYPERIAAVLCRKGGVSSHGAILIRAMEIPCVMHISDILEVPAGTDMICDATCGRVIAAPDSATRERYRLLENARLLEKQTLYSFRTKQTCTADGVPGEVLCNINSARQAQDGAEQGAQGVGLFRTEYLWQNDAPDEEMQVHAYRMAADFLKPGQPLCIRCLDPERDKTPWMEPIQRGIRYCLSHTEQFKSQLRAVLRAAALRPIHLLLPMVTDMDELRRVRELLEICRDELACRGIPCVSYLPVGVMIETPAAVFIADRLAKEADFFSIGTSDLIQYSMASPRNMACGDDLHVSLPILRAIRHAARQAACAGIPCHFCGEAAGDARMIPLLLAFGITTFSVCPHMVPAVRREISLWTMQEANALSLSALEDERKAFEQISRIRDEKVQWTFYKNTQAHVEFPCR